MTPSKNDPLHKEFVLIDIKNEIADLLIPHVSSVDERRTFRGLCETRTSGLERQVALDGAPNEFARRFVEALLTYGENTKEGTGSLFLALAEIRKRSGIEGQAQVDGLLRVLTNNPSYLTERKPYKGLAPYTSDDRDLFMGRGDLIEQMQQRVQNWEIESHPVRFLTLWGGSGSGKSSLVRAGLLPWLQEAGGAEIMTLKPNKAPLHSLARMLVKSFSLQATGLEIESQLLDSHRTLGDLVAFHSLDSQPVWIFVDQFEEIFSANTYQAETASAKEYELKRDAFIGNLLTFAQHYGNKGSVVITVRDDYMPDCSRLPVMSPVFLAEMLPVSLLSAENLYQIITAPATKVGYRVEEKLVHKIFKDCELEPIDPTKPDDPRRQQAIPVDKLPLISEALLQTWEARRGFDLRVGDYESAGGVSGAIERLAERAYNSLEEKGKEQIAKNILLRLIAVQSNARFARRRASYNELEIPTNERSDARTVLDTLSKARLVSIYVEKDKYEDEAEWDDAWVEMRHEVLITAWPRLKEWVQRHRPDLETHARLRDSAIFWESAEKDPSYLYTGSQLEAATQLQHNDTIQLNLTEREFLVASIKQKRLQQRRRYLQWTTTTILLVAGIAISIYVIQRAYWRNEAKSTSPPIKMSGGTFHVRNPVKNSLLEWNETGVICIDNLENCTEITVADFAIEQFEISNQQYALCLRYGPCKTEPANSRFSIDSMPEEVSQWPVETVSALEADNYCKWIGRRLPTVAEWELTLRRAYTDHPELPLQYTGSVPLSVDDEAGQSTHHNIYHLLGNVKEWTQTIDIKEDEQWLGTDNTPEGSTLLLYLVGGTYGGTIDPRSIAIESHSAKTQPVRVGFRCVEQ